MDESLLGTMSDSELARRLHCHHETIRDRRVKLGIPSWDEKRRFRVLVCLSEGIYSPTQIAQISGMCRSQVHVYIRELRAACKQNPSS